MGSEQPFQVMTIDMKGGGADAEIDSFEALLATGTGILWVHLDYSHDAAGKWLQELSRLDPIIKTNLLDDDTRPRSFTYQDGLFLSLRGVNLNPGADPEDMVAVRVWADERCIITSNKRKLLSLEDIREQLRDGRGPRSTAAFVRFLVERLASRAEVVIEQIENEFSDVEDDIIDGDDEEHRTELSQLRRQAIRLKRFFAPQREALQKLVNDSPAWMPKNEKAHIRESINTFNRYLEELDSIRDRAIIVQEEILSRQSETLNQRMFTLSLVATLFLPLGFLTGLLGINVGGIPGAQSQYGFLVICSGIIVIVAIMLVFLKIRKWF